jgi:predicted lipoprotein with Yx(FWY)xxD motif
MHRKSTPGRLSWRTGYAAFLSAIIAAVALAGVAIASSFNLTVAKNGKVTNQKMQTKTEPIAVNSKGHAVYFLTGDSRNHPQCVKANGCMLIWPPVTVKSANSKPSVAKGIKGKLGVWNRQGPNGPIHQLTLGGHPLYMFAPDTQKDHATGEGIVHFGGTWHAITASVSKAGTKQTTSPPPPPMTPPSGSPPLY